jgi:hypothetical protein
VTPRLCQAAVALVPVSAVSHGRGCGGARKATARGFANEGKLTCRPISTGKGIGFYNRIDVLQASRLHFFD